MIDNIFPFLIDKLSESENCVQTLKLLNKIFQKLGQFNNHLEPVLSAIQNEYFNRFQAEIQE
jgi:hypothetical protein